MSSEPNAPRPAQAPVRRTAVTLTPKAIAAGAGAMVALLAWMGFVLDVALPWLWGPYAFALLDAGPVFFSRGGTLVSLVVMPLWAVAFPLLRARTVLSWALRQVPALALAGLLLLIQGYYIHHIVHLQGVDASLEFLAAEIGYKNPLELPQHVRRAVVLSDTLAEHGSAPWLPRAWQDVNWPEPTVAQD